MLVNWGMSAQMAYQVLSKTDKQALAEVLLKVRPGWWVPTEAWKAVLESLGWIGTLSSACQAGVDAAPVVEHAQDEPVVVKHQQQLDAAAAGMGERVEQRLAPELVNVVLHDRIDRALQALHGMNELAREAVGELLADVGQGNR